MKKFIICFISLAICGNVIAQKRPATTKPAQTQVVENDEFPAALKLTPEQRTKIKQIDEEIAERLNKNERTPAIQAQMEEKMRAYRMEKIRAILTPEQQVVFDESDKEVKAVAAAPTTGSNLKMAELRADEVRKMIEMKDDQIEQMIHVFNEMDQRMKEVGESASEVNDVKMKKIEALRNILTNEQFARLNELVN